MRVYSSRLSARLPTNSRFVDVAMFHFILMLIVQSRREPLWLMMDLFEDKGQFGHSSHACLLHATIFTNLT